MRKEDFQKEFIEKDHIFYENGQKFALQKLCENSYENGISTGLEDGEFIFMIFGVIKKLNSDPNFTNNLKYFSKFFSHLKNKTNNFKFIRKYQ